MLQHNKDTKNETAHNKTNDVSIINNDDNRKDLLDNPLKTKKMPIKSTKIPNSLLMIFSKFQDGEP